MKNVKITIMLAISAVLLTMLFQNCSSPFEASIDSYNKGSQGSNLLPTDSMDSDSSSNNNGFQFPDNGSISNTSGNSNFLLPKTGPIAYLYQASSVAMVKDVCLSDNDFVLKIRNSGSNPKLCLTKESDPTGCISNSSNFVSIMKLGYQKIGGDWLTDNIGHSLRQLILPSQAPMSLAVFYMDDTIIIPRQVGSFNVHACANKIVYNHVSFSCPTEDICASFFPETTMETGSCIHTTGGVRINCLPRYIESGSPTSGTYSRFPEPANSSSSNGNAGDSKPSENPQSGGGSNNTAPPISADCGNTTGVRISKFKTSVTGNYYNATETGTVAPGTVMSFPFVIDLTEYPRGIKFSFESGFSSGSYNRKDLSISKCPGQFEDLSSSCVQKNRSAGGVLADPFKETGTLCKVEPGVIYYFNIRPTFAGDETAAILNPHSR